MERDVFRRAMALFPSAVTIVTTFDASGMPFGLTVTAFCPVSLEPPLVLACLDKGSNTLSGVESSGSFVVNLLATGREEMARMFATKSPEKFSGVSYVDGVRGPILERDSAAYLECDVTNAIEAGDHWIYIGRVVAATSLQREPLVYHQRGFALLHRDRDDRDLEARASDGITQGRPQQ